jgi:HEAT repeat protein
MHVMTADSAGSRDSTVGGSKRRPRFQTGVKSLLALVACAAAILWAWRNVSENSDPVRSEAREIQKRAISALHSEKPADRVAAIVELERLGMGDPTVSIPPLITVLDNPDKTVRLAAAEALGSIGKRVAKSGDGAIACLQATKALTLCLDANDNALRVAAASAIGSIGSSLMNSGSAEDVFGESAPALIACLKDAEPAVRSAAAVCLGKIIPPNLGSTATSPDVRKAVMDALPLALADPDAGVRRAVINAMTAHTSGSDPPRALARALKDESAQNRVVAVNALAAFRQGLDPWLPILVQVAEHDPDPSVRLRCLIALGREFKPPAVTSEVTPQVVSVLTASLKSDDAGLRGQVPLLLSEFGPDALAAVPDLLRVLSEPPGPAKERFQGGFATSDPASEAAFALSRIAPGSPEAKKVIAALIEVARSGPKSRRAFATYALAEFGPAAVECTPFLIDRLTATEHQQFFENDASAAYTLSKITPGTQSAERAIAALMPLLESKDYFAQLQAIEALGRFGPAAAAAIPKIRALTTDRDAQIRNAAAKTLPLIEK